MSKTKVPPPDPNVGLAQKQMAEIAQKAEARAAENDKFYRETVMPRYFEQMDTQNQIAKDQYLKQAELQDYSMGLAKKYDERYWNTTAKQQDAFYDTVNKYDTAAARDEMAGQAGADVEQASDMGRQALSRGLARRGVSAGSPAAIAAMADMQQETNLARAGAMTMAQRAARAEGLQLRAQAAGLGGNLIGATAGSANASSNAGQAAQGASTGGLSALGALTGSLNSNNSSWNSTMGLASSNYGTIGNLGMQQWQTRANAAMQDSMGLNQLIGAGIGAGTRMYLKP